jgi:hypothetical protein
VAFVAFNRPDLTRSTFAAIRAWRPRRLFLIADGPRDGHPSDAERCAEVRGILERVDWPCAVHRDFADRNLGLKRRIVSGLDRVFESVDRAIVLEDDCLAHPDFFRFCEELLDRYADDERVWAVTGDNFQDGRHRGDASYYFSRYNHCWGWATWRRAWKHNDPDIRFWPGWRDSKDWTRAIPDAVERRYWTAIFDRVAAGDLDNSWAYPWTASVWRHGGLCATPNANLVSNIGFSAEATHTRQPGEGANLPARPLSAITHPATVERDARADRHAFNRHFGGWRLRFPITLLRAGARALRGALRSMPGFRTTP